MKRLNFILPFLHETDHLSLRLINAAVSNLPRANASFAPYSHLVFLHR